MLGFVRNMLKWGVARWSDASGSGLIRPNGVTAAIAQVYSFNDFSPSILASLVANTTASQASDTVTVNAPAHGISFPMGTTAKAGFMFYYPGSPSIPAGWYPGFALVDANNVTFKRTPSATVPSEPVNGGAAFTSLTTLASFTIPAGALSPQGHLSITSFRAGDGTPGAKTMRVFIGGLNLATSVVTASAILTSELSLFHIGDNKLVGAGGLNNAASVTQYYAQLDMTQQRVVSVGIGLSAAAQWMSVDYLDARIVRK